MNVNIHSKEVSTCDSPADGEESSGGVETPFSLLEHLPIGLLVVDPTARIVFVNEYVELMLGYDRGELLGQPVEMLVPERSRIQHLDMRRVFARNPRERPMGAGRDLLARCRDGSEIPVEMGSNRSGPRGGTMCSRLLLISEDANASKSGSDC